MSSDAPSRAPADRLFRPPHDRQKKKKREREEEKKKKGKHKGRKGETYGQAQQLTMALLIGGVELPPTKRGGGRGRGNGPAVCSTTSSAASSC